MNKLSKLFGDVREGEGRIVALLTLNLFTAMVCYYIIKTVREPLILATGGAELKTYASAAQAVVLMGAVPAYAWLTSRFDRQTAIKWLIVFFLACIEVFFALSLAKMPMLGFVFYVWVGIFSLVLVAQFWSFANDLMNKEQGERLFPIVAIGATAGSWAGAVTAGLLFDAGLGAQVLMQIAAALLGIHLLMYRFSEKSKLPSTTEPTRDLEAQDHDTDARDVLSKRSGFSLVFGNAYIVLIAALLILLNLVNTLGEYILSDFIQKSAEEAYAASTGGASKGDFMESYIGAYYGSFFSFVNAAGVVLQAFFASRLVKWGGIGAVLFALPVVAMGTYGLAFAGVGLAIFRWAKTAENATDYSIMNTAKAMLWLPTTREEKYKAKQAVDTFFVRTGDVLAAGVVFVGTSMSFAASHFAAVNIGIGMIWLVLCYLLMKRYKTLAPDDAAEKFAA